MVSSKRNKIAVGCQGGGMHAAFEVGVLTEILKSYEKKKFELVGLSGTSAGALCALMVWYGLAPKKGIPGSGSEQEAIDKLNHFWDDFVAKGGVESVLNFLTYRTFWAEELEIPVLGVNAPVFSTLSPYGAIFKAVTACLPSLGVRKQYFDLHNLLAEACPALKTENKIDWDNVTTRLLIGASEVVNGFEAVFDSDLNKRKQEKHVHHWRQRLPLALEGVAASGTLPLFREAEDIDGSYYWDGLYSQNPPVREFIAGLKRDAVPDELWIVRINPQQWPELPKSNADIQDRQNELMGNLSLHKELDFILKVNEWADRYEDFRKDHKPVTVRTIKMRKKTADQLRFSSKFDRSRDFIENLRKEGEQVAQEWLTDWEKDKVGKYPEDAAYR